jgi:ankyrin repeat protein
MQERKIQKNVQIKKLVKSKVDIAKSEKPALSEDDQKQLNRDLLNAAANGDNNKIGRLIKKGADVNAKDEFGYTAFMSAAANEDTAACEFLLDKGADINAKDNYGWTALMNARNKEMDAFLTFVTIGPKLFADKEKRDIFYSSFKACIGK